GGAFFFAALGADFTSGPGGPDAIAVGGGAGGCSGMRSARKIHAATPPSGNKTQTHAISSRRPFTLGAAVSAGRGGRAGSGSGGSSKPASFAYPAVDGPDFTVTGTVKRRPPLVCTNTSARSGWHAPSGMFFTLSGMIALLGRHDATPTDSHGSFDI